MTSFSAKTSKNSHSWCFLRQHTHTQHPLKTSSAAETHDKPIFIVLMRQTSKYDFTGQNKYAQNGLRASDNSMFVFKSPLSMPGSMPTTNYEKERKKYLNHFEDNDDEQSESHLAELKTTPLFSLDVRYKDPLRKSGKESHKLFTTGNKRKAIDPLPQYALLGLHIGDHPQIGRREPIMLNTAAPNSTFICGSQGSGKSYTLACMMEDYMLPDKDYGRISNPMAGVAFHYDTDGDGGIAEIASLCSRGIKVRVLVSSSNFNERCRRYNQLAGNAVKNMEVQKLEFRDEHLNIERMNRLMALSDTASDGGIPLYVWVINKILREMNKASQESKGKPFTFSTFEAKIEKEEFVANQKNMLKLRLDILKSFMAPKPNPDKQPAHGQFPDEFDIFETEPATLTVVDLTDPFVDPSTACVLFDICLGLFKENAPDDGLVVALDEAHRYMNNSTAAINFTEQLLTTIRLQRHTGTRVIIATQEPTISERLMDLCSITIVHHFNSPAWFTAIKSHLAGASEADHQEMFERIVRLNVGESLVFSPSSFVCMDNEVANKLGTGYMKMKTRSRKGIDFGKSKMAGEDDDSSGSDETTDEDDGPISSRGLVNGVKGLSLRRE